MIIDGHAHACGDYLTPGSIQKKLADNNVDSVVLVPGEPGSKRVYDIKDLTINHPEKEVLLTTNKITRVVITLTRMHKTIPTSNEHIFDLKKKLPGKVKQFFWITKKQKDDLDPCYNRMKFNGIKLHQCWQSFKVDSDWFRDICNWAESKSLPLFIHLYSLKEVKELINYIKQNKKTKIIVAHHFGIRYYLEEDLKYFENTYFDLSNTHFVSEYKLRLSLKRFGHTKLLMGSDTPYGINVLAKCIQRIDSLDIPDSEKENILGNNMNSIMGGGRT